MSFTIEKLNYKFIRTVLWVTELEYKLGVGRKEKNA